MKHPKRPKLFHLTDEWHWVLIAHTGQLMSRIDKERVGLAAASGEVDLSTLAGVAVTATMAPRLHPDDEVIDGLLWLTQNPTPTQRWQEPVGGVDGKGGILIEVEAPHAVRWTTYRRQCDPPLDRRYMDALETTGGENQAQLWWVAWDPIPSENWVKVTRTKDGLVLYDRERDA